MIKLKIFNIETLRKNYFKIIIEPLKKGWGDTLGNSLRRILLSSLLGSAPVEIIINKYFHEHSCLLGVKEDMFNIIYNLKKIVFKLINSNEEIVNLKKMKEGPVFASDIKLNNNIIIINKNNIIANLSKEGYLNINIRVIKNRGYIKSNLHNLKKIKKFNNEKTKSILLDAVFSPVKKVFYNVESIFKPNKDDLDRLIIKFHTNGSISPEKAINKAIKIFFKQLENIFFFNKNNILGNKNYNFKNIFNYKIEDILLPINIISSLRKRKIFNIFDLMKLKNKEILNILNFNFKNFKLLKNTFFDINNKFMKEKKINVKENKKKNETFKKK